MEIYDYTVEKEESGIRIDRYLAEKDSGLSRSFIQKLLKDGQIVDIRKIYKSGVTDSVLDSYRRYLK